MPPNMQDQGPRPLNFLEKENIANNRMYERIEPKIRDISEICPLLDLTREEAIEFTQEYRVLKDPESKDWKKIGEGGFGAVYKGRKQGHDFAIKECAYKTYDSDNGQSINFINREVKHLFMLSGHENIVQLINCFAVGKPGARGFFYIIMEFADGGDLYDYMDTFKFRRLPYQMARRMFREICFGLNFIHARRISHQDLKIDNILLFRSRSEPQKLVPKITDFGLSVIAWTPGHGIIETGDAQGTLDYCSPEMVFNYFGRPRQIKLNTTPTEGTADEYTPNRFPNQRLTRMQRLRGMKLEDIIRIKTPISFNRSMRSDLFNPLPLDIWALGVTLFVMITGSYPFLIELNALDLLLRGKFARYTCMPADAAEFIRTMLTPLPAKRATIRCILNHDWLKESRAVHLYQPKEKPIDAPIPRTRLKTDPTGLKPRDPLALSMGSYIEKGLVGPGGKRLPLPDKHHKDLVKGWKAEKMEGKMVREAHKPETERPVHLSPTMHEAKEWLAVQPEYTAAELEEIRREHDRKHPEERSDRRSRTRSGSGRKDSSPAAAEKHSSPRRKS